MTKWQNLTEIEKLDRLASMCLAMHLRTKQLENHCKADAIPGYTTIDVEMTPDAWVDYLGVSP